MPTKQQLESALRNAHSAGDAGAAKQLANALKNGQFDKSQQAPMGAPVVQGIPGSENLSRESRQLAPEQQQQLLDAKKAQFEAVGAPELANMPTASTRDSNLVEGLRSKAPVDTVFARELPEIGEAPELNTLSKNSILGGLAAGLITNEAELAQALKEQNPGSEITQDPEGNILVKFPSGGTFAVNKPGLSGQDFVQFAARALAFIPAGRIAGTGARQIANAGIASAGTEAGLQAVEAGVGGEFNEGEIALAGGLGAGFKGVETAAGTVKRATSGGVNNELIEQAREADIPLHTSDLMPPTNFASKSFQQTAEKIPLAGTAGLREKQQELRIKAVDNIAQKYGEYSYSAIIESLKKQKDKFKKASGSVLEKIGSQLDELGDVVPTNKTQNAITFAKQQLNKPGVIKDGNAQSALNTIIDAIEEAPMNFTTLKENRTAFRDIVKGIDKADRSQLTSRAKALLGKIENGMKEDMQDFARDNLTSREYSKWAGANSVYAREAEEVTKTKIKTLLDKGGLTPEVAKNMIFSRNPSEVKLMYRSLTNEGRANVRAALISRVVEDVLKRQAGFTPNSFVSELAKHELNIGIFFKGKDRQQLGGLRRVLDATRRAQDAAVTTPTGQQLLGAGTIAGLWFEPATTSTLAVSVGRIARLYESQAVRNALVRLGQTPRGSTLFEQHLASAFDTLVPAAQSLRSKISDTETPQLEQQQ